MWVWGCGRPPCFHRKPAKWGQAHRERAGPATLRTRIETSLKQALPSGFLPINLLRHKPLWIGFSDTCNQHSPEGALARSQVTEPPCDISCDLASKRPSLTTPFKLPSASPPRSLPVPVQPHTPQQLILCSGPCLLAIRLPHCCTPSAWNRPGTREALGTCLSHGPGLSVSTCAMGGGPSLRWAPPLWEHGERVSATDTSVPSSRLRTRRQRVCTTFLPCSSLCLGDLITQEVPSRPPVSSTATPGPSEQTRTCGE